MATEQIGALVGGGRLVSTDLIDNDNIPNNGDSQMDALVFGATKDIASMRTALQTYDGSLYTDDYLKSLTANDMLFAIMSDQTGIITALTPPVG